MPEPKFNPFSGELKGKLLDKLREDKPSFFNKNLVPEFTQDEDGIYKFSLKDTEDEIFSKVPLASVTSSPLSIEGREYLCIGETKVHKDYKRKGIATSMYRYMMENLPKDITGIYSPAVDRANDILIPKVYDKLSEEYNLVKDKDDNYFLTKK